MAPAILPLHYCSVHHLLFSPALQVWLSCTPVQIEHTFGEAMRLTESTCPRCTTMTQEMLHKQSPKRYPYSEKPEALRGTEGCKLENSVPEPSLTYSRLSEVPSTLGVFSLARWILPFR